MSTTATTTTAPFSNPTGQAYNSDTDSDGQARGGRRALVNSKDPKASQQQGSGLPQPPSSSNLGAPAGQMLKGASDDDGNAKSASLLIGIKLDLEAEIHLTARVRGDISIGLY
ncbi:hypothetical protein SLS54_005166 [Diplodia seriata]